MIATGSGGLAPCGGAFARLRRRGRLRSIERRGADFTAVLEMLADGRPDVPSVDPARVRPAGVVRARLGIGAADRDV